MLIRYYLFEIKPITHDRCQIRAITNCDPFIHMVPNSVIAYIGRKVFFYYLSKVCPHIDRENSSLCKKFWDFSILSGLPRT